PVGDAGESPEEGAGSPAGKESSVPPGMRADRPVLSGTGYSEVPRQEHAEERVPPGSIPKAPRVPELEGERLGGDARREPPQVEPAGAVAGQASGASAGASGGAGPRAGFAVLGATVLKRTSVEPSTGGSVPPLTAPAPGGRASSNPPADAKRTLASAPPGAHPAREDFGRTIVGGSLSVDSALRGFTEESTAKRSGTARSRVALDAGESSSARGA